MTFTIEQFVRWAASHSDLVPHIIDAAKATLSATSMSERAKIVADVLTKCGEALDDLLTPAEPVDEQTMLASFNSTGVQNAQDLELAYQFLSERLK